MSNEKKILLNPKGEVLYEGRTTDEVVETSAEFYISQAHQVLIYEDDNCYEFYLNHYPTERELLYYIALAEKQVGKEFFNPVIEVKKRYYRQIGGKKQ